MAEVKHFIDQSSIQQDGDFLKGILDEIFVKLTKIKDIKIEIKGLKGFGEAKDIMKQLEQAQKELIRVNDQLAASSAKIEKLEQERLKTAQQLSKAQQER